MVLIYIHPKHVSLRNKLLNCHLNNRGLGFTPSASSACDSLAIFFTLRVGGLLGSRRRMDGKAFARWGCWSDTLTNAHTPQQRPLFADLPAAPRKMNGWLWKHNDYITLKVSLSRRVKLGHVFGWLLLSPNADPYQLRFNNSKIPFWSPEFEARIWSCVRASVIKRINAEEEESVQKLIGRFPAHVCFVRG